MSHIVNNQTTAHNENGFIESAAALLPLITGLACARCGLNVSLYASYMQTDAGLISDGTALITSIPFAVIFLLVAKRQLRFSEHTVRNLAIAWIVCEAASVYALGIAFASGQANGAPLVWALAIVNGLAGPSAMFFWLRRAKGLPLPNIATFVFGSVIASELLNMVCGQLPTLPQHLVAGTLTLAQLPAMHVAERMNLARTADAAKPDIVSAKLATVIRNNSMLASAAVGVAALGVTVGLLRGYPSGDPIVFTLGVRLGCIALTATISCLIIALCNTGRESFMDAGVWFLLMGLAFSAITAFAAFPENPSIGGALVTTLNACMVGFCYCYTVRLMSNGWRDPYYYALLGAWLMFFVPRALGRIVLPFVVPMGANPAFALMVLADAVLVAGMLVFARLIGAARTPTEALPTQSTSALAKVVSLSSAEEQTAMASLQESALASGIEHLRATYLLSAREAEVVTLYAQGHTQKKIAEELFIAPGTVHEHVRHIYRKTGLHSRQQILDYIHEAPRE